MIETLEPSEFKIESFLLPYFPTTLIPQRQRVGILIDAANVDDIFQVQMWSRGITGAADLRDNLSGRNELPRRNVKRRAVSVARVAVNRRVINQNLIAVAVAEIVRNDNLPVEK